MTNHVETEIPQDTNDHSCTKETGGLSVLERPHKG
jgi:hypothetical protein